MLSKILGILLLLFVVVLLGLLFFVNKNKVSSKPKDESPSDVVNKYWDASKKDNSEDQLSTLTTFVPESYWKCIIDYRQKKSETKEKKDEKTSSEQVVILPKYDTKDMLRLKSVRKDWPEIIRKQEFEIHSVHSEKSNDDEAIVTIGIRFAGSNKEVGVFEVLLFKEEGKWKIFMIQSPTENGEFASPKK
jgi:hypothetical protein